MGRSGFGMGVGVVLVVVDLTTNIRKGKCQHQERSTTTVINICIQAAGLRLGLLTAVLSDIVHSVMVTVEVPLT